MELSDLCVRCGRTGDLRLDNFWLWPVRGDEPGRSGLPAWRRQRSDRRGVQGRLSGADLVDTAVQPVDVQLGGSHRLGDSVQVFERLRQPVMAIKDSAAVAGPTTVRLLDRAEEPGHPGTIRVVTGTT
jgi:hypothetical protein